MFPRNIATRIVVHPNNPHFLRDFESGLALARIRKSLADEPSNEFRLRDSFGLAERPQTTFKLNVKTDNQRHEFLLILRRR